MPDLTTRALLHCPDCGHEYPGLREPPAGATCEAVRTICLGCGREHTVCVWIADLVRGWPDDPDEERLHGPTIERRAGMP